MTMRERVRSRPVRYVTAACAAVVGVEAFGLLVYSVLLPLTG